MCQCGQGWGWGLQTEGLQTALILVLALPSPLGLHLSHLPPLTSLPVSVPTSGAERTTEGPAAVVPMSIGPGPQCLSLLAWRARTELRHKAKGV